LLASHSALAGDAAARHVIGFSPDGGHFAFEQFTMFYEDDASMSEIVIVDTGTDRFVPGSPVRIIIRGDDGLDEEKAREDAAAKAKPIIAKLKIGVAGTAIEGKPSMALDTIGIYQMDPEPLAKSLAFKLPDGRAATLSVEDKPMGTATCEGFGGRAMAGKAKVAGLRLSLDLEGTAQTILQDDKTLPNGRRCAEAYGVAEAHLHTAPDGTITLAALIEYADNHNFHAGPNRRFLAVTKRIARK
jgi:predicted secreted protein